MNRLHWHQKYVDWMQAKFGDGWTLFSASVKFDWWLHFIEENHPMFKEPEHGCNCERCDKKLPYAEEFHIRHCDNPPILGVFCDDCFRKKLTGFKEK